MTLKSPCCVLTIIKVTHNDSCVLQARVRTGTRDITAIGTRVMGIRTTAMEASRVTAGVMAMVDMATMTTMATAAAMNTVSV